MYVSPSRTSHARSRQKQAPAHACLNALTSRTGSAKPAGSLSPKTPAFRFLVVRAIAWNCAAL